MCVCLCLCMCMCMCVCVCVCVCVCECVSVCVCVYVGFFPVEYCRDKRQLLTIGQINRLHPHTNTPSHTHTHTQHNTNTPTHTPGADLAQSHCGTRITVIEPDGEVANSIEGSSLALIREHTSCCRAPDTQIGPPAGAPSYRWLPPRRF